MILQLKKTPDGFVPCNDETLKAWNKVEMFEDIMLEYKPKRNIKFHKKGFALLNLVFKNQDKYTNLEDLRTEFKLKAGHYKEHISMKQGVIYVPKSMDFSSMDEAEFEELYNKFIDIALRDFVKLSRKELEDEILRFV